MNEDWILTLSNSPFSAHCTPASCAWEHSVTPRYSIAFLHSNSEFSVPLQRSFVSHIGPKPAPNVEPWNKCTAFEKFSIRHATWPSLMVQWSSQTVPHSPKTNTSTRPIELAGPPARRTTMENELIMLLWTLLHHCCQNREKRKLNQNSSTFQRKFRKLQMVRSFIVVNEQV